LDKAPDAFRTISEVAEEIDVPQHVLRFWESRFTQIRPLKRGGGRRYYRPDDVDLLRGVRHLLYGEGYTIRGVQRILREQGLSFVQEVWRTGTESPPESDEEREGDPGAATGRADREPSFNEVGPDLGPPTREPTIAPAAGAEPARQRPPGLDDESRRKLRAALDELTACRRLLEAALADDAATAD
jgi:DNA-binding transcriptional MerR regulator